MARRSVVADRSVAALCGAGRLDGTNAEHGAVTNRNMIDFIVE